MFDFTLFCLEGGLLESLLKVFSCPLRMLIRMDEEFTLS